MLIEEDLKAGRIPCLVATSSLELGIDMGAVDLVIQVESPKSVARGLQRIGRAGHTLDAVSKGRIFPKFRADLLESAVVLQRMRVGAIEETQIPRNPLDVLAQQIVAICAQEEIEVDELHALVRGAYPFADLSRPQLENVLDMLAGRYPSDEFAELRPRIIWDRTAGVVRGREGARRLAVTNAGTIPDRGLFGVFIVDGGGRVGELDEEMVYEARAGQVIMLGASSWRIEEITRDRVLVSPAPGVPGSVPFWKGEGVGRPYELGAAIGTFSRELMARPKPQRVEHLVTLGLSAFAAKNLATYLEEQERATGVVPSDRTVVVERFRDEIGDWRVCILTPFGARVHAPWAMAVGARLRESLGIEVQSIWSDDGIAFHLPDADAPPATDLLLLTSEELDELVLAEVGQTALFGARFRENAARALLIPRRRPGERTPLWQQRLKAQGLLQVARKYASFPIVLETYRECLQDVFDLPALQAAAARAAHARARSRRGRVGVGVAVRVVAPVRLHRDLYVRGRHAAGRAACAGALARPRPAARAARPGGAARADRRRRARGGGGVAAAVADGVPSVCTTCCVFAATCAWASSTRRTRRSSRRERRAIRVRIAGDERLIAAEDAGRYRDALGVMPPSGLPGRRSSRAARTSLRQLVRAMRAAAGRSRPRRRTTGSASTSSRTSGADARRQARARRAPPRRHRARVVRPRCAAPPAPRIARCAAA